MDSDELLDDCNVFVKYLPAEVGDRDLYQLFEEHGEIKSAKVMFDPVSGNSLGYGFVRFADSQQANTAIELMSGKKIGHRTLLCKLSKLSSNHTNLYIKPLLDSTTEEDLQAMFEKFGTILNCKVMVDKNTGTSRRIGFVRFTTKEAAEAAIQQMNGTKIDEEATPLVVRHAETLYQKNLRKMRNIPHTEYVMVPQPVPVPYVIDAMGYPQQVAYQLPSQTPNLSLNLGGMGFIPGPGAPMSMQRVAVPSLQLHPEAFGYAYGGASFSSAEDPNLFVFHLPPEMDNSGLRNLFQEFGAIDSVKVITDKVTGVSKGYGFVKFVNQQDAERALSLNGRSIGTKRLSVSFKTPSPRNSPASSPRGPTPSNLHSPRGYSPASSPRIMLPLPSPTRWPLSPR